jgi:hypothetical protein
MNFIYLKRIFRLYFLDLNLFYEKPTSHHLALAHHPAHALATVHRATAAAHHAAATHSTAHTIHGATAAHATAHTAAHSTVHGAATAAHAATHLATAAAHASPVLEV